MALNTAGNYTYDPVVEEGYDKQTQEDTPFSVPSYLTAADNHSIANNNQTFLESAAETVSNIPKFIGASIISGANQIYNIAPTLGNYMGGDFEISKSADVISAIDEDLGVYYQEHQTSADVAGFLLSSLVPGMAGIRVLNAGQKALEGVIATGKMGKNMKSALGLLAPNRQKHLDKAISEITNSNSLSLMTNKNTVKAMAAGYGQSVLEMAAFETATAITLSESPVLENQDIGDMVTNIAIGGLAFGTIGGVISLAKTSGAIKKSVRLAAPENAPWTQITKLSSGADSSSKISHYLEQLDDMGKVPLVMEPERRAFLESTAKNKVRRLHDMVREELGIMAGGDREVQKLAYALGLGKSFDASLPEILGATKLSRITELTPEEKIIAKSKKPGATIADVEAAVEVDFKVSYATTWGEGLGNTSAYKPQHVALSDTLGKNESMLITPKGVTAGKQEWRFNLAGARSTAGKKAGVKGLVSIPAKGTEFDVTSAGLKKAQARHIWALELKPFNSIEAGADKWKAVTIGEKDIPLLDKMYREFDPRHGVMLEDGTRQTFSDAREFQTWLMQKKPSLANDMLYTKKGTKRAKSTKSQEDIASMLNVRNSYLSGVQRENLSDDMFALQSYSKEYTDFLVAKNLYAADDPLIPVYKLPRTLKTSYDTSVTANWDGNTISGMAIITQLERQQAQRIDNIFAGYMEEETAKYLSISLRDLIGADIFGAGAKFLTAASSNYGTLAAKVEWLGKITVATITKKQTAFREAVEPPLYKLSNNSDAALEWSVLNNRLRGMEDSYVLDPTGKFLEPAVISRYNKAIAAGKAPKTPVLKDPKAPLEIPIKNEDTLEMAQAHIGTNGIRRTDITNLRTAQGVQNELDPDIFYPVPINLTDYPYFALVRDKTITGTGHSKNLYASSAEELDAMMLKLADEPGIEILTKGDAERYYKSVGQYDQTRALNENYLNNMFKRKGLDAPYHVPTDPSKIVNDYLNWGLKQESSMVREFVSAKYERQFEYLRMRGEEFTNLETSQYNNLATVKHAENVVKNPYMSYVKTALGVKNYADYPFWINANKALDAKVSEMYGKLNKTLENSKTVEELAALNTTLREYGYKGAAYDMEMDLLANHTAPRGVLQSVVQKLNGILATVVLRLDSLNAVNNAISANILYGAEMKSVMRAIERGDTAAVGRLTELSKLKVPGTDKSILSPAKMMAKSIKAFGRDTPEMKFFKDNGFVTTISEQYRWTLDNLSLTGKETVSELNGKLSKVHSALRAAADKGEVWTGNRLAEEFNRFNAAHTMKQVTDIAVDAGLMDSKTALSYINTFVNRTQGNYMAAQRPMLFQGAVGQSIGLFQTYQFNLMQQLLRYVGEGTAKDSMTLLGLQGTVFGMNGLPAFNAINTHIVGTASGNTEHKDFYTAVYGAAGKDAGDWLMYGLASNMLLIPDLKTNLYVRGDINPRHMTIVPTDPASVPIVQAFTKFAANIFKTAETMANGGDFTTAFLQGLEHNGLSRPLAGLAQTLQGLDNPYAASYSTSKRGNVIASNDLFSLVNMARMAGGKPLGESVAIEAAYRFKTYALKDTERRSKLGSAIKTTMIAGQNPTQEQIEEFAADYVKLGGQRTEFNQWVMGLYTTANTSQANELRKNLNSPFAKNMQTIMGGYELKDFAD